MTIDPDVSFSDPSATPPLPHVSDGPGPRCTSTSCDQVTHASTSTSVLTTSKTFITTTTITTTTLATKSTPLPTKPLQNPVPAPKTHVSIGSSTRTSEPVSGTNHSITSTSSVPAGDTSTAAPDIPQSTTSATLSSSSSFSKQFSTPTTLHSSSSSGSSFTAHDKVVVVVVIAALFSLVVVILVLIVRYMRRQRREPSLRPDSPPPRYDTSVTPFILPPASQISNDRSGRITFVVTRLLNKVKKIERRTSSRGTIANVGANTPRSDAATVSDSEPPSYSTIHERAGAGVSSRRSTLPLVIGVSKDEGRQGVFV